MIADSSKPVLIVGRRYKVHFRIPSDRANSGFGHGSFTDVYRGKKTLNGHEFYEFVDAAPLDKGFLVAAEEA